MSPAIHSLLSTNQPLSDDDIPEAKKLLAAEMDAVQCLEEQIKELEANLDALKAQHDQRVANVRTYQSLLSPVRRIPAEILSDIFIASLSEMDGPVPERKMVPNYTSIALTQVCRLWRRTALSTPSLWSNIYLSPPEYPRFRQTWCIPPPEEVDRWQQAMERLKARTKIYIDRSAKNPLTITICARDPFCNPLNDQDSASWERFGRAVRETQKYMSPIVNVLYRASAKWSHVNLELGIGTPDSPLLRFLTIPSGTLPLLSSLRLDIVLGNTGRNRPARDQWKQPIQDRIKSCLGAFLWAPSLTSLTLDTWWTLPPSTTPGSWKNLLHLSVGAFKSLDPLDLLERCPNLETFKLVSLSEIGIDLLRSNARVHLIPLHRLRVIKAEGLLDLPIGFSRWLSLPSLTSLEVRGNKFHGRAGFLAMLSAIGSQLEVVVFNYCMMTQANLEACLRLLPNVKQLTLLSSAMTFGERELAEPPKTSLDSSILMKMAPTLDPDGDSPGWCPKVESLFITLDSTGRAFTDHDLVRYILRKKTMEGEQKSRLKSITVHFMTSRMVDVRASLEEKGVDMDGLSLTVAYNSYCTSSHGLDSV